MKKIQKKKIDANIDLAEVKGIIDTIDKEKIQHIFSANDLSGISEYERVKRLPTEELKSLVSQLIQYVLVYVEIQAAYIKKTEAQKTYVHKTFGLSIAYALMTAILRKNCHYTEKELIQLFQSFRSSTDYLYTLNNDQFRFNEFPINFAIKQIECFLKKTELSKELAKVITEVSNWEELTASKSNYYYGNDLTKSANKLKAILSNSGNVPKFVLKTNDIGIEVNEVVESIKEHQETFYQIFNLAPNSAGSKPSAKFIKSITAFQDTIGVDAYRKIAKRIFEIAIARSFEIQTTRYGTGNTAYDYSEMMFLCKPSQDFIKGMVWTMKRFSDKETINVLTKLCEKSYTKIPGKGPAAASVGNACVYVMGNMRGKDGLGALSRLKLKVRQNNVKKTIDKLLVEGAKKYNVSVEELKEMSVPEFRLEKGAKTIDFDGYKLKVYIEGRRLSQQWIKPDGSTMKSVPSTVKNHAHLSKRLKELRKEVKEIQKVFSAQKQRIDNQFILDRTWDFSSFRKYYLDHGLVRPISEKLIWIFAKANQSVNVILQDEKWFSVEGHEIDWIDEDTEVKLWHPVNATEEEVIAWREKMMELEWKQPIKQAFREIYILTDAEVNTITYSNRMAAHILKQHQFNSLANLRNWKYSLLGVYDDGRDNEICRKYLPEYKITAEFWIDELNQDEAWNDTGIYLYIATDQVKFHDENNQPMELINVPKMVFTEIMRDVDMFVGVCSVGNDPQWMDNNGERQSNRDYWTSYSFGDLTEIAKTRKTILERLLPRLKKIRDKSKIEGKFLKVQGKLRTYKIHIGSGNILMEPNDQYLCIVPSRSSENSTDKVFIPFEGDKGLSIVLSKAFLLAEDDKISDSTITSQINR